MKTAVMVYWSKTGNTEKVTLAIKEGLNEQASRFAKRAEEAADGDFSIRP